MADSSELRLWIGPDYDVYTSLKEEMKCISYDNLNYVFRSVTEPDVTPCVHRRQIVERQFCRYGVFNTFK
jgi:hypothetical protein